MRSVVDETPGVAANRPYDEPVVQHYVQQDGLACGQDRLDVVEPYRVPRTSVGVEHLRPGPFRDVEGPSAIAAAIDACINQRFVEWPRFIEVGHSIVVS